jgi:hypothetical protein
MAFLVDRRVIEKTNTPTSPHTEFAAVLDTLRRRSAGRRRRHRHRLAWHLTSWRCAAQLTELDISMVRGINSDTSRGAPAAGLMTFAATTHARIDAEGDRERV